MKIDTKKLHGVTGSENITEPGPVKVAVNNGAKTFYKFAFLLLNVLNLKSFFLQAFLNLRLAKIFREIITCEFIKDLVQLCG